MLGLGLGTSKGGFVDALAEVTNTKSILFDGGDEYVDCGDVSILNSLGNLTISAWIKVPTTGSTEPIFTKIKDDNEGIFFAVNGNHIIFQNEAGSDCHARFDYDDVDDEWHHVAVTFDGSGADNASKVVMYLDGQSQTIEFDGTFPSATDSDLSSNPLYIGARKYSSVFHPYQGNIDEVAFWNDTLTASEILQIYNGGSATLDLSVNSGNYSSSANIQGWWRMGDIASTRVVDDNANNLVIPDMRKTFFSGKSIDFDGTDDEVLTGTPTITDYPFTLSTWAKSVKDNNLQALYLADKDTNNRFFGLAVGSSNRIFLQARNTTQQNTFSTATTFGGSWVHIVGVYESATDRKLYINGVRNTDNENNNSVTFSDIDTIAMGSEGDGSATHGQGQVCDSAIWNVALDANTIASIYNSGEPNNLTLSASYTAGSGVDKTANLQAYYRMGNGTLDLDSSSGSSNSALLIADQTNATLGSELITDPTFSLTGTQSASTTGTYWETGADWSIGSGVATHDGSGTSNLKALAIIDDDGIYKISITVGGTSTPIVKCQIGSTSDHSGNLGAGTHTFILKSSNTHDDLIIRHVGGAPTIDDVSCKKIQGNAGVMENMSAFDIVDHAPNRNSGDMINFDATADIETDTP